MVKGYEETDIMDIAAAIKSKSGNEEKMRVADMAGRIMEIQTETTYNPSYEDKTVTPTKEVQAVVASAGYDALKMVTVLPIPDAYIVPSGSRKITSNGTYVVSQYENVEIDVHTEDPMSGTIESERIDAIFEGGMR